MNKYRPILQIILGVTAFLYVFARAYLLAFTHDEATSFLTASGDLYYLNSANNHLLNTYLMRLCGGLLGWSELSLRLPNVLAFVVYVFAVFNMLKSVENFSTWLLGIGLLIFNPWMLEYFSLARGYGISLGCMALGMVFLFKGCNSFKQLLTHQTLALCFGALAVWANLGIVNMYIAVVFIVIINIARYMLTIEGNAVLKWLCSIGLIVLSSVPFGLAVNRLLLLNGKEQLYFGAGSLHDTFLGLTMFSTFSTAKSWGMYVLEFLIIGLVVLGVIVMVRKRIMLGLWGGVTAIMIISMFGHVFEAFVFDAMYPLERTSLYLVLLLGLFLVFMFDHISDETSRTHKYLRYLVPILLLIVAGNFAWNANVSSTSMWGFDKHNKQVLGNIMASPPGSRIFSCNWLMAPSFEYYTKTRSTGIELHTQYDTSQSPDFIYDFDDVKVPPHYGILEHFEDVETTLWYKTTEQ